MKLWIWTLTVGLSGLSGLYTLADEPQTLPKRVEARAVRSGLRSGRKHLESLLQTPSKLKLDHRNRVTVGQVLDALREQRGISLRFDTPELTGMFDAQTNPGPTGGGGYYPPPTLGAIMNMKPFSMTLTGPNHGGPAAASQGYCSQPPTTGPCQYAAPTSVGTAASCCVPVAPAAAAPYFPAPAARPMTYEANVPDAIPADKPPTVPYPDDISEADVVEIDADRPQPKLKPAKKSKRESGVTFSVESLASPLSTKQSQKIASQDSESQTEPQAAATMEPGPAKSDTYLEQLGKLLDTEIDFHRLDLSRVSIATVLRHTLDAPRTTFDQTSDTPPFLRSNALLLDYLIEDDAVLITSRVKAFTTKETRVYSIKQLGDIPPDQLVRTIRQSIRPWSWRSQFNDLGDQLKGTPIPAESLNSILKTGIQIVGSPVDINITPENENSGNGKKAGSAEETRQMELLGSAIANGLVTLAHSTLLLLEMNHYADPPTGTIQLLGNRLIVTQSQAAHREIAELLKQLDEE